MIFDSLDNFGLYVGLNPWFADVREFLTKTDIAKLVIGKHPINDRGAYASVNEYDTKLIDDCFIECHQKFIDIHIIAYGQERIGVASKKLCVEQPYNAEKDLQKLTGQVDFITLIPGWFAVFFLDDAHEPGVRTSTEAIAVKKIVFKIPTP